MSKETIYREDAINALHEEWDGGWLEATGEWVADNCEAVLNRLPSADRPKEVIAQITFDEEKLREIVKEAVEHFKEEYEIADRPQGEWVRTGRTNIYGGIEVQCSNCGDKVMVQHLEDEWYCRHCGADMGMKGADDE